MRQRLLLPQSNVSGLQRCRPEAPGPGPDGSEGEFLASSEVKMETRQWTLYVEWWQDSCDFSKLDRVVRLKAPYQLNINILRVLAWSDGSKGFKYRPKSDEEHAHIVEETVKDPGSVEKG